MKTLDQHFSELPLIVLQVAAQNQGLEILASGQAQFARELADRLREPGQISQVWRELSTAERAALRYVVGQGNRAPVATFQRRFGELRRFGVGRLAQAKPWLEPTGAGERLWYRGLLTRSFEETDGGMVEFIGAPTDLLPLLPISQASADQFLPPPVVEAPEVERDDGERLLDDLASVLIHVQNQPLWLDSGGRWRQKDLQVVLPQLQRQPADPSEPLRPGGRTALIWALARQVGFLRGAGRKEHLGGEAISAWLQRSRYQQARFLFEGWRLSETWNDLCLTPHLHCEAGNWRNDPVLARRELLAILGQFEPGSWFRIEDLVTAIYEQRPDFQRPDGNYDAWYIRLEDGPYLKGFGTWPEVEGRLVRYLWSGPLHWLGVTKLAEEGSLWSLSERGAAYLERRPEPEPPAPPPLVITSDFRVQLPVGARIHDRFRVARFCVWESSWPGYRYRITQRGLRRAAAAGVSPERVLEFLTEASRDQVPANVRKALTQFQIRS